MTIGDSVKVRFGRHRGKCGTITRKTGSKCAVSISGIGTVDYGESDLELLD